MSGFNRHPWLKWEQIEKFLGQKLPFGEKGQTFLDNMSWVEGYVQDMLKKAMPGTEASTSSRSGSTSTSTETFETHEHVIVKVRLPKEEDPRAMRVFVKSNQLKITGYLSGKKKTVKLPALVLSRSARVTYKQRTLEIRMRKSGLKEHYIEAFIRF